MQLEQLIEALDSAWRTVDQLDAHIARLMGAPEWDTLTGQTQRAALDAFNVLERDGAGRVRKRPGYKVPSDVDFEEAENRKLREIQEREREHFAALDKLHQEARDQARGAERAVIRGVVIETLQELGLISDAPAQSRGRE